MKTDHYVNSVVFRCVSVPDTHPCLQCGSQRKAFWEWPGGRRCERRLPRWPGGRPPSEARCWHSLESRGSKVKASFTTRSSFSVHALKTPAGFTSTPSCCYKAKQGLKVNRNQEWCHRKPSEESFLYGRHQTRLFVIYILFVLRGPLWASGDASISANCLNTGLFCTITEPMETGLLLIL